MFLPNAIKLDWPQLVLDLPSLPGSKVKEKAVLSNFLAGGLLRVQVGSSQGSQ
ncbi:hypothetical protein BJX99DRAFT_134777 [Aspergillus californicus]